MLVLANRLLKPQINQALVADFDRFHGVKPEGLVLLHQVEFHARLFLLGKNGFKVYSSCSYGSKLAFLIHVFHMPSLESAWIFLKVGECIRIRFGHPIQVHLKVDPFLYAYFIRKNKLPISAVLIPLITTLLAACYINFLPEAETSDTLILACIHLPLFLWGMLGFVYSSTNLKDLSKRLSYLNYNGETIIVGGILLLAGGLLTGITIGLFDLIGISIEDFYFEYIAVYGLAAAPLLATLITQTNPELVNKVPPIVAKIFSPLVLVMLLSYLLAIVYAGKDPYNDRDFLLLFNILLIGVMALIFFSVAESYTEKKAGYMTWILVFLSLTTLLVNGIALSAIAFRISEWGITPNRLAVLGVNLVMLVHLVLVSRQLILTVRGKSELEAVGLTLVRYLPIYLLWTAIVCFLFPVIFGFE